MRHIYRINEIKLHVGDDLQLLPAMIATKLSLRESELAEQVANPRDLHPGAYMIRRESIDARDKSNIRLVYTVDFELARPLAAKFVSNENDKQKSKKHRALCREISDYTEEAAGKAHTEKIAMSKRPVVVGFGPCGIFAALELAKRGCRPIVIERGSAMDKRIADVERFRSLAGSDGFAEALDEESNVLFGEGGAGTFSDGKLTSGIKDDNIRYVLEVFAEAGADSDILYKAKPHIGTDVLREVIVNIRRDIEALGGEIRFDTKLVDFVITAGELSGVVLQDMTRGDAEEREYTIETDDVILALGHSARDTFAMLHSRGLSMEQKPFSIGVRMEHPQELIDRAQYGAEKRLPPADYKISYKAANGRGVYSFCMCPGGEVIVCSTQAGELCVNGMSNRNRDSGTANSGILCDVRTSDFEASDALAGIRFQQRYEQLAFANGGGRFVAPSCLMRDFLDCSGSPDTLCDGDATAADKVVGSLPDFAVEAIREAVPSFARRIAGYDLDDALVTAVETRSSAPLRIIRDGDGVSSVCGIYPAGEGAGYAGGITSAACDGIRAVERMAEKYRAAQESQSE